jgi:hypothetical protein
MRATVPSVFAAAILLASAAAPGSAMSIGSGLHVSPGMNAMRTFPPTGSASVPYGHPLNNMSNASALSVRIGPVPLKAKRPGKLNGACYRSCVKTSMGDAFRTDQFCAYSCSLD